MLRKLARPLFGCDVDDSSAPKLGEAVDMGILSCHSAMGRVVSMLFVVAHRRELRIHLLAVVFDSVQYKTGGQSCFKHCRNGCLTNCAHLPLGGVLIV